MVLKPRSFDPAKKYPLVVHVYGEPADVTVTTGPDKRGLFHRALAADGYLVRGFDNRGTPAPKGRAWRKIHLWRGRRALDARIRPTRMRSPCQDAARTSIAPCRSLGLERRRYEHAEPDVPLAGCLQVGVSVAPVPDQKLYDTHLPGALHGHCPPKTPRDIRIGSPINFADGLRGKLLIVHGTGDDNVHFQGTERSINRLVELGKAFDFMPYPNRTHAISEGNGTTLHVYSLIARYFEEHLPAGPRD